MFEYYQPNEKVKYKKDETNDCVVRAFCKTFDLTWKEVFSELCEIGIKLQKMPNDRDVYSVFLEKRGWIFESIKVSKGSKRPTIKSFCERNKGNYILNVARHMVSISDGNYYDSWDSGDYSVYSYYYYKKD